MSEENKKLTFEQAMQRLDQIVIVLEGGKAPLEESLKLFEEATKLTGFCSSALENARLKILELSSTDSKDISGTGGGDFEQ